jgi:hypothetical protein
MSILKIEIDEITRATGKNNVYNLGYDDYQFGSFIRNRD